MNLIVVRVHQHGLALTAGVIDGVRARFQDGRRVYGVCDE
jgi:hypothetical protein